MVTVTLGGIPNLVFLIIGVALMAVAVAAPWLAPSRVQGPGWRYGAAVVGAGFLAASLVKLAPDASGSHQLPAPLSKFDCLQLFGQDQPRPPLPPPPAEVMGLVSGAPFLTYATLGDDVVAVAKSVGEPVANVHTRGTIDNLDRVSGAGNAAVAFIQSDVAFAADDVQRKRWRLRQLRQIVTLHREEVHVLARRAITSLAMLNPARVVVSDRSQGSWVSAVSLLRQAGASDAQLVRSLPERQALCEVLADDGQADALVIVAGKPTPLLESWLGKLGDLQAHPAMPLTHVHFMPLNLVDPGANNLQGYEATTIGHQDYAWLPEDSSTPTVAVRAMLVAYDFSMNRSPHFVRRCASLSKIVPALLASLPRLQGAHHHPAWRSVEPTRLMAGWQWDMGCSYRSGPPQAAETRPGLAPAPAAASGARS